MENCWEEAPHTSQDYYPHYNLFQSSIFYDTDNFRVSYLSYRYDDCLSTESGTSCAENQERSAEPPDKQPEDKKDVTEGTVTKEKRIITKDELYEDPDKFRSKHEDAQSTTSTEPSYLATSQPWGYDWTKQSWVKAAGKLVVMSKSQEKQETKEKKWRERNLYKQLANAPRVQISKAESMMQKMGWQGGALGKASDGIEEPIIPNTRYAYRKSALSCSGFGERTEHPVKSPPNKKVSKREIFRTNVLLHILDFVQDDTEIELLFDVSLRQHERRFVHTTVHSVINEQNIMNLTSVAQYDLVSDIRECNKYELGTVSDGEVPNRQLIVYKEAPEHVYLITPDDFQPKTESDEEKLEQHDNPNKENVKTKNSKTRKNEAGKSSESDKTETSMDLEEDENPFLKSIKNSLKRDDEPKSITNKFEKDCNIAKDDNAVANVNSINVSPKQKMLEFFQEFVETDSFKELRFLGKFSGEQIAAINELLNDVSVCIEDVGSFVGNEEFAKFFRSGGVGFEIKEGRNGTTEIHKLPARARP